MISYRKLAMRVLGHPLRVPTNTPRPASHRVTALALTAAMVAGMAAPAYAGTYYIGDGDITITKDESGTYVKQGNNSSNDGKGDKDNTDIVIKGGKRSEDTTAPGGSSSEGGTSATSAAKSASATLKVEDSENEDKDMVYPDDTKGSDSSDGGGEEKENQSTEKDQTSDTTDGKNTGAGSSDPESTGSDGGTTGSGGTSDSERSDTKADDTLTTGGEENDPKPGGIPTPAEGTESTESNRSAPESQFTYTSAYNDEGTPNESTTALKTAADNFKAAATNVIRIINKLVNNESTGKDNTLNVTLDNVNITANNDAALSVEGAGDTKITLRGSNTLTNDLLHAGLEHNEKSEDGSYTGKLTITSEKDADGNDTGSLTATGGNGAAGIGSSDGNGAGTIEITGGNNAAGIGSGDIGSGYTGSSTTNITISGGTIKEAVGGNTGDGIGGGSSNNTTVTINGGRIEKAQGGQGYSIFDGGDGIHSDDALTIPGTASIGSAIGGSGGSGLFGTAMKIISSTIGTAKGGEGKTSGGNGIYSVGPLTIQKATITNATGGNATSIDGTGGSGIFSGGKLTIENSTITNATGGDADNGTGGSGKRGGSGILGKTMEILTSTIKKAIGGRATGEGDYTGGAGIAGKESLTIKGDTRVQATGGNADSGTGGSGIFSDRSLSISGGAINATGGSGKSGGAGIASSGTVSISNGKIEQATGGRATGEDGTGGSGIHSNGTLTIRGGEIQQTAGGDATGKGGTGGSGIRSGGSVKIWGGTITKATGGSGKSGGDGIGSYGDLTISGSAKIETAQGGDSTNGTGGSGISSGGILTIEGSANIGTAQGGASTNGTGGDGIHSGSVVKISGDTITKATGGSGKSGGAGVSTESGIVSIGNSDTPLDLTATAPDADNAIRGRDGKKLDEIIHLEENGKLGLVKLVENGVTRLFHNGVYTKSIYPAGSETHPLGDWVITKKPTCTEKGERQRSCKVEHCVVTETEELPALGHQWSGWMPVQGDSSREYRICAGCGAVEYRDVSHNSGSSDSTISTGLRVLDPAQADILQNAQLVRLNQISDVLYIDVTHETASLQGVLSDLTGLRSENIETVVFSTERCTSTLSLSDIAALGADDTPFTLRHSGSTASFTVGGADHSALLR
ncbi:beta strand repeat-containing protein [Faecalibacterium prausnitzii]|uniref:beta strand repeat-containing protein n=1 Tax=Faecalibacterium prausnitzii TaxID=853 RepID=UPI0022DFA012|nr:hypothetical protein [Faecalibacterium prausnitzii]